MPFAEYQRQVVAYHGCDQSTAQMALRDGRLDESTNDYDWLGKGVYFWEHGPGRALEWAQLMSRRRKVKTPAVVGALIQLGHCFDLLDVRLTRYLQKLYPLFEAAIASQGQSMPVNDPAKRLHRLDCAFLNWAIPVVEHDFKVTFQTVRGVFIEGDALYHSAQIFVESHVQIAVRDPSAIVGFFHPAMIDKA